jgi:type IV pilus assembly protein PilA
MRKTSKDFVSYDISVDTTKGFTLVELLVVIVIIGILTAIGLPSFLNQTSKARQTEAKQNISVVLRGQQMRYSEVSAFATTFDQLALGNSLQGNDTMTTENYIYQMAISSTADERFMSMTASTLDKTWKSYAGALSIARVASQSSTWSSIQCGAKIPGILATAPADTVTCPTGFKIVTTSDPS